MMAILRNKKFIEVFISILRNPFRHAILLKKI